MREEKVIFSRCFLSHNTYFLSRGTNIQILWKHVVKIHRLDTLSHDSQMYKILVFIYKKSRSGEYYVFFKCVIKVLQFLGEGQHAIYWRTTISTRNCFIRVFGGVGQMPLQPIDFFRRKRVNPLNSLILLSPIWIAFSLLSFFLLRWRAKLFTNWT